MRAYIPLTQDDILTHSGDLYLFLRYIRELVNYQFYDFGEDVAGVTVLTYLKDDREAMMNLHERLGVSRQTLHRHALELPRKMWRIVGKPVTMMPIEVFDRIIAKLDEVYESSVKSRNAMLRIYLYMYFNINFYHNDFRRPQDQMAAELSVNVGYLNRALKTFIEWGWLIRTGKFKFTGDKTFAYRHTIPDEMAPQTDLFPHFVDDQNHLEFY